MEDKHISRFGQVSVYVRTFFRLFCNEKRWKTFISAALIIFMISMVTEKGMFHEFSDTKSGGFALVSASIWIGIFNSLRLVCRERAILKREHRVGLHMSSYMAAHMVYGAFLCGLEALLITVLVALANFKWFPRWGVMMPGALEYYISTFLTVYAAHSLGLAISAAVKDENTAMAVMPFALILQLILAGAVFELEGVAKALSAFTVSRWGLAAICSTAKVNDMTFFGVDDYAADPGHLLWIWFLLAFFALAYAVAGTVFLEFIDKDKR